MEPIRVIIPLVSVISIPYLLFGANIAYLNLILGFLIIANSISLALSALIVNRTIFANLKIESSAVWITIIFIFFMMAFYHFSSYPFALASEHGNVDAFAMVFYTLSNLDSNYFTRQNLATGHPFIYCCAS